MDVYFNENLANTLLVRTKQMHPYRFRERNVFLAALQSSLIYRWKNEMSESFGFAHFIT